jgi:ABC-2 type transport system ATP-binding protein
VDHCTLKCVGCITKSDSQSELFVDVNQFEKDIKELSKFMRVKRLNLMGGEPLLHPKIDEFIRIAKKHELANKVIINTNGELLANQTDYFWETVDGFHITLYENTKIDRSSIKNLVVEDKYKKYNYSHMVIEVKQNFFKFYTKNKNLDTQEIFNDCSVAKQCHYVSGGKYYKCIMPILQQHGDNGSMLTENEILSYINDSTPLKACYGCNGTSGPTFRPIQRPK